MNKKDGEGLEKPKTTTSIVTVRGESALSKSARVAGKARVAIAQFNPFPGDLEGNAERIIKMTNEAKAQGADIVLFPEMALTAYAIGDKHKNQSFIEANKKVLVEQVAPAAQGVIIVLGFIDYDAQRRMRDGFMARFNAYAVLAKGKLLSTGKKTLLIDDGVLDDSRHYVPGTPEELSTVDVTIRGQTVRLGILVCQDAWDDDELVKPAQTLARQGAELLLVLNSSPFYVGKVPVRQEVIKRRALETKVPVVYCNTVGVQDNGKNVIVFDGGSFAVDEKGSVIFQMEQFVERVALVEPGVQAPFPPRLDELYEALVFAIKDFYEKTGVFKGVVLGLSGGIDSAVDAALFVEAIGADKVLAVNMPSRFNSATTKDAAAMLAQNLGVEYVVHPIQAVVEQKTKDYVSVNKEELKTLTLENIQARERGNILMTYSQERGFMVVGNGNKTEFQRGYATLYGDIIGALMPLGDVNKLDVYALGRLVNERAGKEVIPKKIFTIPPSAELSDAQDVDAGAGDPFDYYIESPIGVELVEHVRSPAEVVQAFKERSLDPALWPVDLQGKSVYEKVDAKRFQELVESTFNAIKQSYFKRVQAPPIIVVSRRAFGFDYRETLFNKTKR